MLKLNTIHGCLREATQNLKQFSGLIFIMNHFNPTDYKCNVGESNCFKIYKVEFIMNLYSSNVLLLIQI